MRSAPAARSLRAAGAGRDLRCDAGRRRLARKLPATKTKEAIAAIRPGPAPSFHSVGCERCRYRGLPKMYNGNPCRCWQFLKSAPSVWHDAPRRALHDVERRATLFNSFSLPERRMRRAASRGGALCHSFQFIHLARAENAACALLRGASCHTGAIADRGLPLLPRLARMTVDREFHSGSHDAQSCPGLPALPTCADWPQHPALAAEHG